MAFLAGGGVDRRRATRSSTSGSPCRSASGVALTLDESALLLELEDVYWTEQGVLSVQITLSAISLLGPWRCPGVCCAAARREFWKPARPWRLTTDDCYAAKGVTPPRPLTGVQMTCSRPGPTPTSATGDAACARR